MTTRQELIVTMALGLLRRTCPLYAVEITEVLVMLLGHEPPAIDSTRIGQNSGWQPLCALTALSVPAGTPPSGQTTECTLSASSGRH